MSTWDITITIKSVATGEVVEELEMKSFDSRREAEAYLLNHPTWENHMTFPVAVLHNSLMGNITLDPTNWNHIHAVRNHKEK